MKRLIIILLCILPVSCLIVPAFANSPGPNIDGTYDVNPVWIIALIIIYSIIVAFTCVVEWLVAKPFHLRDSYGKWIVLTNVVTQIVMHILELVSLPLCPDTVPVVVWYSVIVVLLEILVVMTEFLIYRRKFAGVTKKECLLYTLCANAASAIGGLLLLMIII